MSFNSFLARVGLSRIAALTVIVSVPAAHAFAATDLGDQLLAGDVQQTVSVPLDAEGSLDAEVRVTEMATDSPQIQSVRGASALIATRDRDDDDAKDEDSALPVRGAGLDRLVSAYARSDAGDAEAKCLAGAVYHEAKGEPLGGQLAVAEVILNRVRSGRFASTICGVVLQRSQFSFVRGGRIPAIADSAAWRRAVGVARVAIEDLASSPANRALYFHARHVSPRWERVRLAAVGNHIFYR